MRTSRPSLSAALTASMESSGCFLQTSDDGGVHLRCHPGDEHALQRWSTAEVLSYIEQHRAELWSWLRAPVGSLPSADVESLFGPLGGRTGAP